MDPLDQAFGPPPLPPPKRPPPREGMAEMAAAYMFPLSVALALIAALSYLFCKTIEQGVETLAPSTTSFSAETLAVATGC